MKTPMLSNTWTKFAVIGVVLLAAGSYWYAQRIGQDVKRGASTPEQFSTLTPKPAPRFDLKDPEGKSHTVEEFKDKIVLIHFWASWCPPCIPELPEWLKVSEAYAGKPLRLVAINQDEKWEDAKTVWPEKVPEGVLGLWDSEGKLPDKFGTYQFPETYLLNGRGEIIYKWVGPQDWSGPAVKHLLDKALDLIK
jgi:thiol-disulfide isomerase/thioredoxin